MSIFGAVQHTLDNVIIVGGGPSATMFRHTYPSVPVIAVNAAVAWSRRADFFFTLDPSPANRRLMREQRPDCAYYAAVPDDYGSPSAAHSGMRAPAEKGVTFLHRLTKEWTSPLDVYAIANCGGDPGARWSACDRLATRRDSIHTGNSAYGALGLAFHMMPRRIALYVDATQETRVDGGTPGPLNHLPYLFLSAIPQLEEAGIDVRVPTRSNLIGFPKHTEQELLSWISSK